MFVYLPGTLLHIVNRFSIPLQLSDCVTDHAHATFQRIEHLASLLASQFSIMERVRIELTAACTKPAPVTPKVSPAVLRLSRLDTDGVVSGDD